MARSVAELETLLSQTIAGVEARLGQALSTLERRIDAFDESLDELVRKHGDTTAASGELKKDLAVLKEQFEALSRWKAEIGSLVDVKSDIAVIKNEITELKKMRESWGNRFWALGCLVGGALLGAVLSYASRKLP